MQRKSYYAGKIEEAAGILEEEKAWIRRNQGEYGEIYLNTSDDWEHRGTVNPYFACQAAMGLLTGKVTERDLDSVAAYLSWHADRLIESGGIVCDYKYIDGKLEPTGTYDSVDSYLAVFLTLFASYAEQGGDLSALANCREAVEICADQLRALTTEGLTSVSEDNGVAYVMDNAEVYEAYSRMAGLMASDRTLFAKWDREKELKRFFAQAAEDSRLAIGKYLWNSQEGRYEIGLNGKHGPLKYTGWQKFYPDAAAQIYPVSSGLFPPGDAGERLYRELCEHYDWEYLYIPEEDYDWPVLSYIAVSMGDIPRAETYLKKFYLKYSVDRGYPLHTADSGWTARTCDALISRYEEQKKEGFISFLLKQWKGSQEWNKAIRGIDM